MTVASERAYTTKEAVAELEKRFNPNYRTFTSVSTRILNKAVKDRELAVVEVDGNVYVTESAINMYAYWRERSIPAVLKLSQALANK